MALHADTVHLIVFFCMEFILFFKSSMSCQTIPSASQALPLPSQAGRPWVVSQRWERGSGSSAQVCASTLFSLCVYIRSYSFGLQHLVES